MTLGAEENIALSRLTSFGIGGPAAFVLRPRGYEDVAEALRIAEEADMPCFLLGKGSNILADDSGFDGLIIRLDTPLHPPVWDGERVVACAAGSLCALARESVERQLSGLERLCGIPGSVGGACAMNAGAYGSEIADVLKRVRVLKDGVLQWVTVQKDDLGYRRSVYAFPASVIVEAEFLLERSPDPLTEMQRCMNLRREKQPLEYPSAGSVFKRPEGYFAGALIEGCGLKGFTVGGAQVSPKHAGFIVNVGGATCGDVLKLIEIIKERVLERYGVSLECEIKRFSDGR